MERYVVLLHAAAVAVWLAAPHRFAHGRSTAAGARPLPPEVPRVRYDTPQGHEGLPLYCPGEIIVKFDPDMPQVRRDEIVRQHACSLIQSCGPGDLHLVRIAEGADSPTMAAVFEQHEEVEYAELNYYAAAAFVPDDRLYPLQWNLDNDLTGGIRMQKAWDIERGDPNVIVAVVDTGAAYETYDVYRQAPDLADTRFVPGYDFVNDDDHPNDDQGHGTHVTGTIAQSTNNGIGVAGVAFGCSIMPVKVLDGDGVGDHFTIARGILFAVEHGARIINMSLGSSTSSRTLRNAVAGAHARGVTVVCAGGNDFLQGNRPSYPAAEDPYCLAVGAVRFDLQRAPYSNTGAYLDLVAPGGDLQVDQNNDGYADGILQQTFDGAPGDFAYWFFQGTSMATPHVSGVAALLASRGVIRPDKIRQAMELTARDLGPSGWDAEYGWGMVDAAAALAWRVAGDFTGDNVVAAEDLLIFTGQWLGRAGSQADADLNADHRVDFADFALLAGNWDR